MFHKYNVIPIYFRLCLWHFATAAGLHLSGAYFGDAFPQRLGTFYMLQCTCDVDVVKQVEFFLSASGLSGVYWCIVERMLVVVE